MVTGTRSRWIRNDGYVCINCRFVTVFARPGTMYLNKLTRNVQSNQRMMPNTAAIVDSLQAIGHKDPYVFRARRISCRSNSNDVALAIDWDEGLASQRVSLHQSQMNGLGFGHTGHSADRGTSLFSSDIHPCQVRIPPAFALIDGNRFTGRRDYVSIGSKRPGGYWLSGEQQGLLR